MNRRQLFGRLGRLMGGLGYAAWQTKGCLSPQPAHAMTPTEAQGLADGTQLPLTALDGRTYTPKSVVFDIPEGNDAPEVEALLREAAAQEQSLRELTEYAQQFAAGEYQAAYHTYEAAALYRRTVDAYRAGNITSVAKEAGCFTPTGEVDYGALATWEYTQFGPGWLHPTHPSAIRHEAAYRRAMLDFKSEELFDWHSDAKGPFPPFVGGPQATAIVAAPPDASTTLVVSGGKAYTLSADKHVTVCVDAPHPHPQAGIAMRFLKDWDIQADKQSARHDSHVVEAPCGQDAPRKRVTVSF